ncbi:YggT family protein [Thermogemmatispora sp.]|uniref:YggT family protein n=1 Tax=Thermogemmatispora sp. TaxID=1968838 RepID=UPI001E09C717|nr:YggT family protein [Thermogemmatispora sp.]MBX5451392.1 YggT family protein [Thermogemmatispora sp.]
MFGLPIPILHWIVRYGIGLVILTLVIRAIASWFGIDERYSLMRFLASYSEPFVKPVRNLVPPVMFINFSLTTAIFILYTLMVLLLQALPSTW